MVVRKLRRPLAVAAETAEAGFTLVELLVSLLIGGVIAIAMTSALSVTLQNQTAQESNLSDSHHADLSASFFAHDVASATGGFTTTATACDGGSGSVLNLVWRDLQDSSLVVHRVSYVTRTASGKNKLQRVSCVPSGNSTFTLSDSLATASSASLTCDPNCGSPKTLTLTATQKTDSHLFSTAPRIFSLTGSVPSTSLLHGGPNSVPPPLLILGNGPGGISVNGTGSLCVTGGTGVVDSSNNKAIQVQGTSSNLCGGFETLAGGGCDTTGRATCPTTTSTDPVADPFASVTAPSCSGNAPPPVTVAGVTTYSPGTYPNDVTTSSGTSVFLPGTYCFNKDLTIKGDVSGNGVLLKLANGSNYDVQGGGSVNFTAPSTGNYQGFVLWYRGNNDTNPVGNTDSHYTGIYYSPSSTVDPGGTGFMYTSQLIADGVTMQGSVGGIVAG